MPNTGSLGYHSWRASQSAVSSVLKGSGSKCLQHIRRSSGQMVYKSKGHKVKWSTFESKDPQSKCLQKS